jgi:hypothetical protein
MAFFRRKSKEEDLEELKDIVERTKVPEMPETESEEKIEESSIPKEKLVQEETMPPTPVTQPTSISKAVPTTLAQEPKRPAFAPLFVKIEKYRSVLNHISDLKTTIIMLKNALGVQKQIESLRDENRKFLELAINKIDKKIFSLDTEFLRPRGFEEEFPPAIYETEGLEGVVDDLKKQIEGLKSELKTIS